MDLAAGYVTVGEASSHSVLEAVAGDEGRESTAGCVVSDHYHLGNKPAEKHETASVVGLKSMQENEYAENVTIGAAAARVIGGLKHQRFMSSAIRILNDQSHRQSESMTATSMRFAALGLRCCRKPRISIFIFTASLESAPTSKNVDQVAENR
jgi:hypothetical protein